MLSVKPLSQRDPAWANKKLGNSNYKIGTHGCTITALTCLLNHVGYAETPDTVNNNLKKVGAFSGALLIWHRVPLAYPKIFWAKNGRYYNYNNIVTSHAIYWKKMPVMVEVNAAKIGAAKHWVLFIGNQKMIDPWFGDIRSTREYIPTGLALFERR